jgi:hypothetical protein
VSDFGTVSGSRIYFVNVCGFTPILFAHFSGSQFLTRSSFRRVF